MAQPPAFPDRLRFTEFEMHRLPNGRCRARVVLSRHDEQEFTGESEGLTSQAGELRCAAESCVTALNRAVEGKYHFDLLGVKAVRAFDSHVVIVSLALPGQMAGQRLVGCYLSADPDASRGAALAVLNATNRIIGNKLFMR